MTKRFWWNCEHMETDTNLGVAYCMKYNNFCLKNKCEELYDHKGKLAKELIQ